MRRYAALQSDASNKNLDMWTKKTYAYHNGIRTAGGTSKEAF